MKSSTKYIIFGLLSAALLPYFIICFYALPFADDFCFGWTTAEDIPFLQKFLNQYLNWNGRYTSDVLVNIHPLATGRLLVYQFSLFASLLATPFIMFVFLQRVIKDKATSLLATLFVTLFYLSYLPNLTEGVYWYIGVVNYHLGNLVLLLQLTLFIYLVKSPRRTILLEIVSCLLLVIAIGFNEIGAVLIPLGYLIMPLVVPKSTGSNLLRVHFGIATIAAAFVIFSPGNQVRGDEFPERYQLFHSLFYASMQTLRFIATWSINYPFLALSLVIAANAERVKANFLRKIDYRVLLIALVTCVFAASFIPYFATGTLGQHRTLNYVLLFFILLWPLFVISASHRFNLYQKLNFCRRDFIRDMVLMSSVLVILFTKGIEPLNDLFSNRFESYQSEFLQRQKNIIAHSEQSIPPLHSKTSSFRIVDAKGDSTFFADKCMKRFYEETKIELR